jgi:Mor family transcriptional regulator
MKEITPVRSFYLPSGRVIVSRTNDGHFIESTEMRDVTVNKKKYHLKKSNPEKP